MCDWLLSMEAFAAWLCEHESAVVGVPGRYFDCPVARWLSEVFGRVYGVDGRMCWLAGEDWRQFRMPSWAHAFAVLTEQKAFRVMTGGEAFMSLACIEKQLSRKVTV